jgi:hypothetical protein
MDGRRDGRTDGQTNRGKKVYPPPPSGSGGIINFPCLDPVQATIHDGSTSFVQRIIAVKFGSIWLLCFEGEY